MAYDATDGQSAYRTNDSGLPATDYRGRRRDDDGTGDLGGRGYTAWDGWGRDRLGIHLGWEVVLLVAVGALVYLLHRLDPSSLRRPALDTLLVTGAAIGLLALGAGLTLRAGVPNLALGPIAVGAALHYAENGDHGLARAALPALAIAAGGALVVAALILALHVPGWAATLAGAMGVVVYNQMRTGPVTVQGDYDPSRQAFYLFGGVALLAVLGGALGTVAPIRKMLGRMRPVGDPAARRGAAATLPVVASLVLSSVFAVVAGILMAAISTRPVRPLTGLEWTGIAFGTALLAGTSVFGRRGGIFGTLLAAAGMTLFLDYSDRRNLDIALFAIAAGAVGGGLIISRVVETYGRPLAAADSDDWAGAGGDTNSWSPGLPDSWSPSVPAQNRTERWDEPRWGTTR
jgi:hypothetical protein